MEQFEKVCKGLQTAVDSDWMWRKADYIAMCCKDALSLIRQQRARIAELEAEQEPIPPVVEQEMDDVCSCIDDVYRCGKCGCRLYRFAEKNKYCPDCGKAVRWDATD